MSSGPERQEQQGASVTRMHQAFLCVSTISLHGFSTLKTSRWSDFLHGASKGACLERKIQEEAVLPFMSQPWKSHSVMSPYFIGRGSRKSLLHPTHGETSTLDYKSMGDAI